MPKAKRVGAPKGKGKDVTPVNHKSIVGKWPRVICGKPQNEVNKNG